MDLHTYFPEERNFPSEQFIVRFSSFLEGFKCGVTRTPHRERNTADSGFLIWELTGNLTPKDVRTIRPVSKVQH